MIFRETGLEGCVVVEPERHADDRGFFTRTYDMDEFVRRGLELPINQCSLSWNRQRWTLRGLHFQAPPDEEAKLVRCTRGRIFDVAVDLRPGSSTFGRWTSVVLDADNRLALFVPKSFAHGFLTLEESSEVTYSISTPFESIAARGVRWDDPALGIAWPAGPEPLIISDRDRSLPTLHELSAGMGRRSSPWVRNDEFHGTPSAG